MTGDPLSVLRLAFAGFAMAGGFYWLFYARRIDEEMRRNSLRYGPSWMWQGSKKWSMRLGGTALLLTSANILLETIAPFFCRLTISAHADKHAEGTRSCLGREYGALARSAQCTIILDDHGALRPSA